MNTPRIVVGVLIYNEKEELFLFQTHKWHDKWIVPGGHLEWGETLEKCARREVKEETNLEIENIEFFGVQESINSEEFHEKRHMIFMDYSAKLVRGDVVLNQEAEKWGWFSPQEALKLDLNSSTREFITRYLEKK